MPVILKSDVQLLVPYHYFELWLADLISNIFGIKHLISYSVYTKSLLMVLAVIGFWMFARRFTKNIWIIYASPLLLTLGPVLIDYSPILQGATLIHQSKMIVACLFLMSAFYLWIIHSTYWFLPLLVLSLATVAAVPVIFSALLIHAFLHSTWRTFFLNPQVWGLSFVSLWLGCFYILFGSYLSNFQMPENYYMKFYQYEFLQSELTEHLKNLALYLPYSLLLFVFAYIVTYGKILLSLRDHFRAYWKLISVFAFASVVSLALVFLTPPWVGENAAQFHLMVTILSIHLLIGIFLVRFSALGISNFSDPKIRLISLGIFSTVIVYNSWVYLETRISEWNKAPKIYYQSKKFLKINNKLLKAAILSLPQEYCGSDKMSTRGELVNAYKVTGLLGEYDINYLIDLSNFNDFKNSSDELSDFQVRSVADCNKLWRLVSGEKEKQYLLHSWGKSRNYYSVEFENFLLSFIRENDISLLISRDKSNVESLLDEANMKYSVHLFGDFYLFQFEVSG